MTEINGLRQNTLTAATAARDTGLITPRQFGRMTDGTVSLVDVSIARDLVMQNAATDQGGIARQLNSAVAEQNRAQSPLTSIKEAMQDYFLGGANHEIAMRLIRNIR